MTHTYMDHIPPGTLASLNRIVAGMAPQFQAEFHSILQSLFECPNSGERDELGLAHSKHSELEAEFKTCETALDEANEKIAELKAENSKMSQLEVELESANKTIAGLKTGPQPSAAKASTPSRMMPQPKKPDPVPPVLTDTTDQKPVAE